METKKTLRELLVQEGIAPISVVEKILWNLKDKLNVVAPEDLMNHTYRTIKNADIASGKNTVKVAMIRYQVALAAGKEDIDGPDYRTYPLEEKLNDGLAYTKKPRELAQFLFHRFQVLEFSDLLKITPEKIRSICNGFYSSQARHSANRSYDILMGLRDIGSK